MTIEEVIKMAEECGFDTVAPLDTKTLITEQWVRDACISDKCKSYERNWGCPPHGETLADDQEKLLSYKNGIIFQCVGHSDDPLDWEMYRETGEKHSKLSRELKDKTMELLPGSLLLSAGGCRLCKECARPEPCRFPEKRTEALEGYGIFVTKLCQNNNIQYNYGQGSIAYTGALLW